MNQTQKGISITLTLNQEFSIFCNHLLCFCINLYNNGVEGFFVFFFSACELMMNMTNLNPQLYI
ncbi:hypothetical protein HanIR_Chr06g0279831 [Helianthus annuus]|nr:hypothetical protein HanIR_Chr06g0279831 [Helianthus annuus]